MFLPLVALMIVACGPSDEEVARAAEESISNLSRVAVANVGCSVSEVFSGGNRATEVMERYSTKMEGFTDSLDNNHDDSNREKMRVIGEMNELHQDWEVALEGIGCDVPDR